jgi:hypothetical protein
MADLPNGEGDALSKFRDAFLDYLEGDRQEPPGLEELPEEQRPAAESFIRSITAARGVDPYASWPAGPRTTSDHLVEGRDRIHWTVSSKD